MLLTLARAGSHISSLQQTAPVRGLTTLMKLSTRLLNLYLRIFPRPFFEDVDLRRLSDVCADINGMTIVILTVYILQNFYSKASTPITVVVIVVGVAYLALERWFIFKGKAKITIFFYGVVVGMVWLALTYISGTVRHTQSMILAVGLAYVTVTLGLKRSIFLGLFYGVLVFVGWYIELARTGYALQPAALVKHVAAVILSLVLLATICEILRRHLVENYRLALIARDRAQQQLMVTNTQLQELLTAAQLDLSQAVRISNVAVFKETQFNAMDAMVSGLAHEMGTPIGNAKLAAQNIGAWSNELKTQASSASPRALLLLGKMVENTEIVSNNLNRTDALLKSFKRLSLDQTGSETRDFDLAVVIKRALLAMKPEIGPVTVATDLEPNVQMHSLPYAIEQIVSNLVANALRHGLKHTANPRVEVITQRVADPLSVRLTVTDNGIGISPENLPKIFNHLFTTSRAEGGSGMGLSVVRFLAQTVLGGTITVKSDATGTQFDLVLPRKTEGEFVTTQHAGDTAKP